MAHDLSDILEECLELMASGSSLDEALAAYPAYAEALRPYLQLAMEISALPIPEPAPGAMERGWKRVLTHLRERNRAGSLLGLFKHSLQGFNSWAVLKLATLSLVMVVAAGMMVVNVSASALPGDSLYSVKRSWESIRLQLAPSAIARASLQQSFNEERQVEVQKLVSTGRSASVEFEGPVQAKNGDRWQVGKVWVQVDPKTVLKTEAKIGERVGVEVVVQPGGQVHADNVEQAPPAPVVLTATDSPVPEIPATASATLVSSPTETPMPSDTPTNLPSSTDTITSTVVPVESPTATLVPPRGHRPTPTSAPGLGQIASPTQPRNRHQISTPTPTLTPTPTSTSTETDTPLPTSTDTNTPTPTETLPPPEMPSATQTATPSFTPLPTSTETYTPVPTSTDTNTPTPTETLLPTSTADASTPPPFNYFPALRRFFPFDLFQP